MRIMSGRGLRLMTAAVVAITGLGLAGGVAGTVQAALPTRGFGRVQSRRRRRSPVLGGKHAVRVRHERGCTTGGVRTVTALGLVSGWAAARSRPGQLGLTWFL